MIKELDRVEHLKPFRPMHSQDPLKRVLDYHERTKHHLQAYARSLGYLDWATQPDPFRRFEGAPRIPLDHPPATDDPSYDALFEPESVPPQPLNRKSISHLFYDGLALSAWKQAGSSRWSLRINPSSGDLHPTEGYLIAGPIEGLSDCPGIYHYSPFDHALERRTSLAAAEWQALAEPLPENAVLVALASIYWRESWKYGERAFRYCHHDAGHAIGAIALAAAALGWQSRLIDGVGDRDLAVLLGVDRQSGMEAEHPDCLLALFPGHPQAAMNLKVPVELLATAEFAGTPNRLSGDHHPWPIIDEMADVTRYDGRATGFYAAAAASGLWQPPQRHAPARRIIRQRRSAVALDGATGLDRETFFHMLARVSPQLTPFPFDVLPWRPRVSLALFVHRVRDLAPGLYALIRDPAHREGLQAVTHREFVWEKPASCPEPLELYRLGEGDARELARTVSCHQEIAADGAFALGMLAEFEPGLRQQGAWLYPRLFWETGLIGQVLYLEAEAAGLRATGIGCFFDDAMHRLLGIGDRSWQSLYHFTVGGALDDPRLKTLHPYFHLKRTES